ncbi:MAG: Na(+)/H(+) antiporter subunit D [Elusimicrobia bacterium]|nr:Na(+)/H(+) antiporter subunit D [Elusimicrobiota bacterium]
MTEWAHPALLLLAGAALLPLLGGTAKKIFTVALPLAALALCAAASRGSYAEFEFLGQQLAPWRVDRLSTLFSCVFSLMGVLGAVYAFHKNDARQQAAGLVYLGGALGVTLAGDLLTLFVFWELMALSAAALVFAGKKPESGEAGLRYLLVHLFGGVCLLSGILLHAAGTGSVAFESMTALSGSPACYLILAGFLLNAAVPPLGAWLPDAYPRASVTGAVLLTAYTTKSAVYALMRGFPGAELLIWLGAAMAVYGVIYAVLENDARRLLAYHIISQVGYMVCGVGIGTQLALNGAAAHASAHIIYKGLLFMGAGAVLEVTGKSRLSELGGLYRSMPATMALYLVGALSISAFPLFSGFVSKAMVVSAAGESSAAVPFLLLTLASAGTFLHTGLKLPYYMFFWKDSGVRAQEPPQNMLAAMALAALLCLLIGLFPQALYSLLPFPCDYRPYTASHIVSSLGILGFTALGFFMFLRRLDPEPGLSLDTDWFYRKGAAAFMNFLNGPFEKFCAALHGIFFDRLPEKLSLASANPRAFMRILLLEGRLYFSGPGGEAVLRERLEAARNVYPGDPHRYRPVGSTVLWVITFLLAYLALYYLSN